MEISVAIAPGRAVRALVVPELPEVGALLDGHTVSALEPCPPRLPQPVQEVYRYAIWIAHFADSEEQFYLAIHEEQAERL